MNVKTPQTTTQQHDDGLLSSRFLRDENRQFEGSGGVSRGNRSYGFLPAFRDSQTGAVYLSRFANGRVAPMHLLDGLPLITRRTASGHVAAVTGSVTATSLGEGCFYTRDQAANAVSVTQPA